MASSWKVPAAVAALGLGALALGGASAAGPVSSRIVVLKSGRRVLVHRGPRASSSRVLVYFHGNGASISAIDREVMPVWDKSSYDGIVVVPQLKSNGEPEDLGKQDALKEMLRELGLLAGSSLPRVDVLAHSGGYKAAAATIDRGGVDVGNVGLLDSLYGNVDTFTRAALSPSTAHFSNIFGPSTAALSTMLAKAVEDPLGERAVFSMEGAEMPVSTWRSLLSYKAANVKSPRAFASSASHGQMPVVYGPIVLDAWA